jgi:hypothetical protein
MKYNDCIIFHMSSNMFRNTQFLLPNLCIVKYLLQQPSSLPEQKSPFGIYTNRIGVKHELRGDLNILRIWHTTSWFDIWYDDYTSENFIAGIDYQIHKDQVKIDFMDINDENCVMKNPHTLSTQESKSMNHAMIEYIKYVAKEHHISKILVDVHQNLRIFELYYKPEGFIITSRPCSDNPYWVEAECQI